MEESMLLKELFRYRNACMGFAILWIMFFHCGAAITLEPFQTVKALGYGGVDIFIFASGIGCWHSLKKNPDALSFLERRARRVLPTWITFMLIWWSTLDVQGLEPPPSAFLGNLFFVQAFIDWRFSFNWYMSALPVLYILAPYFFALSARRSPMTVLTALLILTVPFLDQDYLILVTRLPIFFLGFYVGARRDSNIDRRTTIGVITLTALGFAILIGCEKTLPQLMLSRFGLWWYPFILITPGLCLMLSTAFRRLPTLEKIFGLLGGLSFEVFLMHIMLWHVAKHHWGLDGTNWLMWFAASLVGSAALRSAVKFLIGRR